MSAQSEASEARHPAHFQSKINVERLAVHEHHSHVTERSVTIVMEIDPECSVNTKKATGLYVGIGRRFNCSDACCIRVPLNV